MKKSDFITVRIENTLKEFLVSEARIKNKSLSSLLRFLVRKYIRDKYKPEASKQGGLR